MDDDQGVYPCSLRSTHLRDRIRASHHHQHIVTSHITWRLLLGGTSIHHEDFLPPTCRVTSRVSSEDAPTNHDVLKIHGTVGHLGKRNIVVMLRTVIVLWLCLLIGTSFWRVTLITIMCYIRSTVAGWWRCVRDRRRSVMLYWLWKAVPHSVVSGYKCGERFEDVWNHLFIEGVCEGGNEH